MIKREYAEQIAQNVNCKNWVNHATENLSKMIIDAANTGRREVSVDLNSLVIGSENLDEAGYMLSTLHKMLNEEKYSHVIYPNGELVISW